MGPEDIVNSFNAIYQRYYTQAFTFTKSYVHNDFVAEDIVTESLLKIWDILKKEPVNNAASLLFIILKNKSLDHLRVEKHKLERIKDIELSEQWELDFRIATLEESIPEHIFIEEIEDIVRNALKSLPEQSVRVFELSRFECLTNKEISERLGITVKGVEYHLTKTLKILRIQLSDYLIFILTLIYFL
ncbi:MAG: RNA polymerase sigma-70 factor [Prevotella sp.]|jgi:RNA polymerase sigma-70 factor (ECF subfamily)|nr:RNA polymerase sigma-70 factor [Prevotella sp.]